MVAQYERPSAHKAKIFFSRNKRKPPHGRAHKRVVEGALLASLRTPKTRYARFREPQPLGINPLCGFMPSPDPYRESKNSCQQQTHLGRAIYAPKMEELAKTKIPAVHRWNGGRSGFQRQQPLARFLGSFFAARQRMNIEKPIRSARDMVAQYERP